MFTGHYYDYEIKAEELGGACSTLDTHKCIHNLRQSNLKDNLMILWHNLEDNIKIPVKYKDRKDVDWIRLEYDRVNWRDFVNIIMTFRIL